MTWAHRPSRFRNSAFLLSIRIFSLYASPLVHPNYIHSLINMRSTLALLALGAASVSAVAIPGQEDIKQMKRDIIARQTKNLIKRNSVTTGGELPRFRSSRKRFNHF